MFFNPFSNERYTLVGLCLFGRYTIARMDTEFAEAADIETAVERAIDEDADVRLALGEQKGRTFVVDSFLDRLHAEMKARIERISVALGGRGSEGFLAFFPKGLTGYSNLSKREAPAVMRALTKALASHGARLDDDTRAVLGRFEADWTRYRTAQQKKMGEVASNRVEKRTAREQLEDALWAAARAVLNKYAGDAKSCLSYFQEHLLKEVSHAGKEEGGQQG